ncbi:unnamed protein product [Leuciscus chuanchicus]
MERNPSGGSEEDGDDENLWAECVNLNLNVVLICKRNVFIPSVCKLSSRAAVICSYLFTALDKTSGTGYLTLPSVSALLHNEDPSFKEINCCDNCQATSRSAI